MTRVAHEETVGGDDGFRGVSRGTTVAFGNNAGGGAPDTPRTCAGKGVLTCANANRGKPWVARGCVPRPGGAR